MDFLEATDALLQALSQREIAEALGVSLASVRQARMNANAKGWRSPPKDWCAVLIRLAAERADYYLRLVEQLKKDR